MQPLYTYAPLYPPPGMTFLAPFLPGVQHLDDPCLRGQRVSLVPTANAQALSIAFQPPSQFGVDPDHCVSSSSTPPCAHNNWDNLRAKHSVVTLCCRDCHTKWKQEFPIRNLCPEFHASVTCPLDVNCPFLHVHRFKSVAKSPTPPNHVTGGQQDPAIASIAKDVLMKAPGLTPSAAHAEVLHRVAAAKLSTKHSSSATEQLPGAAAFNEPPAGISPYSSCGLHQTVCQVLGNDKQNTVESPTVAGQWPIAATDMPPPWFHARQNVANHAEQLPRLSPASASPTFPSPLPFVLTSALPPSPHPNVGGAMFGAQGPLLTGFHPLTHYPQHGLAVTLPQNLYHPQHAAPPSHAGSPAGQFTGIFASGPHGFHNFNVPQHQTHAGTVMFYSPMSAFPRATQ